MKKLKIGIIGCGQISKCLHVPDLLGLGKQAEIAGLCDIDVKKASALAKANKLDVKVYKKAADLLASGIDAVVIATPNDSHYELTMQSLKAGVHVLVEKPMTTDLRKANAMLALAEKQNLILQTNQTFRYLPMYNRMKQILDSGELGAPQHVRCLRVMTATPNIAWSPGADWFVSKAAHGGLLMDIAVHMADLLHWFFGGIKSISAQNTIRLPKGEVIDNTVSLFRFENGATGVLELSWTAPFGASAFEIYCEKGTIILNPDSASFSVRLKGSDKVKTIEAAKCKFDNSHTWFINAIRGKSGNPAGGNVGRNAVAILSAMEKSSESGKAVKPLTV